MTLTLRQGDTVVLLGCSNGRPRTPVAIQEIDALTHLLTDHYHLQVKRYDTIYVNEHTGETYESEIRAKYLYEALWNSDVVAIFDVTGGDLANETLCSLTELMAMDTSLPNHKYYVGYSDNSVMLNAFMHNPSIMPVNFLLTQVIRDNSKEALHGFEKMFIDGEDLFCQRSSHTFGGNLRCTLKLAGTAHWLPSSVQTLLVEGLGGDINKVRTYLAQLEMLHVFPTLELLIVGEFTEIEQKKQMPLLQSVVQQYQAKYHFDVAYTEKVGHKAAVYPFNYKLFHNI